METVFQMLRIQTMTTMEFQMRKKSQMEQILRHQQLKLLQSKLLNNQMEMRL